MKKLVFVLVMLLSVCSLIWSKGDFSYAFSISPTFGIGSFSQEYSNVKTSFIYNANLSGGVSLRANDWVFGISSDFGLSFDSNEDSKSLGTFSVLSEVGYCKGYYSEIFLNFLLGYNFTLCGYEAGISLRHISGHLMSDILRILITYSPQYGVFKTNFSITALIFLA